MPRKPYNYLHVTQVIPMPEGLKKIKKMAPEVLEMASERGKRVHAKLKTYLLSICQEKYKHIFIPELDYEAEGYFQSGKDWIDRYVDKVLFVEKRFLHPVFLYEGTPDLVAILKGHIKASIADFKTPIQYDEKHWSVQLSAYEQAVYHSEKIEIDQLLSVRVREKGKRALVDQVKEPIRSFQVFLHDLSSYRYYKG